MNSVLKRMICGVLLLAGLANAGVAQSVAPAAKATAVISGRISVGENGAPGIEVIAVKQETGGITFSGMPTQTFNGITDADGRYRIMNVPPGNFRVTAYAPAYVTPGERNAYNAGKTVNLTEGETAENVDFSLIRGGVVTGKLTDEDGRAVIEEPVYVHKLDPNGKRAPNSGPNFSNWQTDDRGVYRIYGLEPGRYFVSAGASSDDTMVRVGRSGGYYQRTFHPEAIEEEKAKIVEVKGGDETENIDIKLARAAKGYVASGRVIDGDTGKPIVGVMIGYGVVKKGTSSFGVGSASTNSLGEFRLEGLTPNSYTAYAMTIGGDSESYSESVKFEVTGGDISGLEIKMNRGASISGTAVVENSKDPAVLANLAKIRLGAQSTSNEPMMGSSGGMVAANGTFKLSGLRPGKTRLYAQPVGVKGFSLLRIENNGAEVKDFELNPGDQISGVRLVFTYGSGVIAGRVEVKGGTLPPGASMSVSLRRDGQEGAVMPSFGALVDSRGQFLLEGISQGNYKLTLTAYGPDFSTPSKFPKTEQIISVAGDGRQEVSMILDLSAAQKENDK